MNGPLNDIHIFRGGYHHQRDLAVLLAQINQSGKAVGSGHVQVQQDDIKGQRFLAEIFQPGKRVGLVDVGVGEAGHDCLFQGSAEEGVIVSNQYGCHDSVLAIFCCCV